MKTYGNNFQAVEIFGLDFVDNAKFQTDLPLSLEISYTEYSRNC